jgi:hypothetical protein
MQIERERQTEEGTEGQTDMTYLSTAFRNFAKRHKILYRFFKERDVSEDLSVDGWILL